MGFCARIPFSALIATLFVAIGTALVAGGLIFGLRASEDFLDDGYADDNLKMSSRVKDTREIVSYVCYGGAAVMAILCFTLLIIGFLATSKDTVWGGGSVMSHTETGRRVNALLTVITFIMMMVWTGILTLITVPVSVMLFLYHTTGHFDSTGSPIDLRYYMIVPDNATEYIIPQADFSRAHDDIRKNLFQFYFLAFGGAFMVVWGLVLFLVSLASTWGRGVENRKAENYLYRRNMEQKELDNITRADKFGL